ncbi:unnamed protein product [Rotaria sp. Silwood2]|nr:unnamed protein product [Rotaria sp. Silwood2]CAF2858686.1 unnamed protein product [Rotaria sp. Silwood2]CAF3193275.1 unnamed protein product [Rotaria sp. Silwood2]CAF3259892.1 unnamed protein product [Rotaria sp. Silwood2]CAF4375967.1 unnamed protein product [Rotaria sp. Silwood2]
MASAVNIGVRLINLIKTLNLYDEDNELPLAEQLLSTRVYIVSLLINFFIIISFAGIIPQTRLITVPSPSPNDFEKLADSYRSTIICRCSQVTMHHKQVFSFNPQFHQVCSSNFINEEWFSSLFNTITSSYYPLEFRLMASAQFQILSLLCRISRQIVFDALTEFYTTLLISTRALTRSAFNNYTITLFQQFNTTTITNHRVYNSFISSIIEEHRFISALRTNFYTRSIPGSDKYETFPAIYPQNVDLTQSSFISNETCRCDHTSSCIYPAGIYNQSKAIVPNEVFLPDASLLFAVPGFQVGCVPQNALLQSTLECFYNQSCLDIVIKLTGALPTVHALNMSSSSRFDPTTTVSVIFDQLMLESWHNSADFAAYFRICAPKTCSYSYQQRFYIIYIVTVMTSVFCGLSKVLNMASPLLVKLFLRLCSRQVPTIETDERDELNTSKINLFNRLLSLLIFFALGCHDRLWKIARFAYLKATTLNLFKTTFTNVKHGIYSTRIYIILLLVGIGILTIYSTKRTISIKIIVQNPNSSQFEELYKIYPSILSCPCRRISIPRSIFAYNEIQFHPICTSHFIRDEHWFEYWTMKFLNGTVDPAPSFHWADFRKNGLKIFNYVRIVCDLITQTASYYLSASEKEDFFAAEPTRTAEFNELTTAWSSSLDIKVENYLKYNLAII